MWYLLVVLLSALAVGCSGNAPYVWVSEMPPTSERWRRAIRPGDKLQVVVHGQDAMSGEFEVRPGGDLVLPVAGRIMAKNATPEELAGLVTTRLSGIVAAPHVTVVITVRRPPTVSVLGEVTSSGRYELRDGDGVLEALARAGGLTAFADHDAVYVVRRGLQASRIRFRYADLAGGSANAVAFELLDGDVVLVQ